MAMLREPAHLDGVGMEEFVASAEGLRTVLTVLDRMGPTGWQTLPVARTLLRFAEKRFKPVAKAWHRPPEDATYAAFMAMRGRSVRAAADPWGVITRAVELSMQAETYGERLLISAEKARRPTHRPTEAPVRAGEHEEFLYDIAATHPNTGDADDAAERPIGITATFLVVAGWPHVTAHRAVEYIAMRTADLGSRASALDTLGRDDAMRLRLGLHLPVWRGLTRLLIGPKAPAAELGVLARVLLGDTLADLLGDTRLVERARHTRPGGSQ